MNPEYIKVEWFPLKGMNSNDNPHKIGLDECVGFSASNTTPTLNFLFQQKKIRTRPALVGSAKTGITAGSFAVYAKGFLEATNYTNLLISDLTDSGQLYRMNNGPGTQVALTGPATTLGGASFHNAELVNGVVLVGNNGAAGILRWDISAGDAYTALGATAPFRYVTGMLSRAVGAYDPTIGVDQGSRTVGWSVAGDETTWTGATNGSGLAVLSDIPDEITGIATLHNTLVVCRRYGFHLGFQTGLAFPAFRFEMFSRKGPGVFFPRTLATDNEMSNGYSNNEVVYFVGNDDIYTFDLNKITAIGGNMKQTILASVVTASATNPAQGFITRVVLGGAQRSYYHLFIPGNGAAAIHYIFDIETQVWSQQRYSDTTVVNEHQDVMWNMVDRGSNSEIGPGMLTHPGSASPIKVWNWDDSQLLTAGTTIQSGVIAVGDDLTNDYTLQRALLSVNRSQANQPLITMTLDNSLNDTPQTESKTKTIPATLPTNFWQRAWFDLGRMVGQNFVITLTTDGASGGYEFDSVVLTFAKEAQYRGA